MSKPQLYVVQRKQMEASIHIQGHGAPAAELIQQVALLSPGAASNKIQKNIWCFSVPVCVWGNDTKHTDTHSCIFWIRFPLCQSDCLAPSSPLSTTNFILHASRVTQGKLMQWKSANCCTNSLSLIWLRVRKTELCATVWCRHPLACWTSWWMQNRAWGPLGCSKVLESSHKCILLFKKGRCTWHFFKQIY